MLADIAAPEKSVPWRTCQVCHALATIPETEAAALRRLLASEMRYSELASLLADDEDTPLDLEAAALSRHARGKCEAREKSR